MRLINITPHAIRVFEGENSILNLEPAGQVARVKEVVELRNYMAIPKVGSCEENPLSCGKEGLLVCPNEANKDEQVISVPLYHTTCQEVEGLPMPQAGVYYIVSKVVASACPSRDDLLVPQDLVRDEEGQIIGCRGFTRLFL